MNPPQLLPGDINAEVLLAYYPEGTVKLSMQGMHKRNSYGDVIDMEPMGEEAMHLTVGRNSIYNSLPEYLFHPIDRFDNLPQYEEKERFREQLEEQAQEISDAYRFFAPIDLLLLKLQTQMREKLDGFTHENVVMQKVIGDSLTDQQLSNRFIRKIVPFLPQAKNIRGNRTLLTFMMRKIFMEEGLSIRVGYQEKTHTDQVPRYGDKLDMALGDSYVGNCFSEPVLTYEIHYWSDGEAKSDHFMNFIEEIEEFRYVIQDFFLSVEQELRFDISDDNSPLRLNDDVTYNYLNYNTNL